MKKILLLTAAAVGLLLGASCQKIGQVESNGNVTFSIQTPVDAATKAIGNGENVDIVHYEIYKAVSNHANSLVGGKALVKGHVPMSGKSATLSLNLLEDQDYVALFWAQVDGKNYYKVDDLRNVEVIYEGVMCNDEDRAAFCQKFEFNTTEKVNKPVTLLRPFAQLNLGTTKESLNINYKIEIEQSSVTVTSPARFFNVSTLEAHTVTNNPVTFALAADPEEDLTVNDVDYKYVAMNYFLIAGKTTSVDIEFDIVTDKGTVNKDLTQVPVQKNYRTNILGNLLTKETKIEIVVDNRFAGEWNSNEDGSYTEVTNPEVTNPDFNN